VRNLAQKIFPDTLVKQAFLKSLGSGEIFRFVCCFEEKDQLCQIMKTDWPFVCDLLANTANPVTRMFSSMYEKGCSREALSSMEAFVSSMSPLLRSIIAETAIKTRAEINANMAWVDRDKHEVRAWLRHNVSPSSSFFSSSLVLPISLAVLVGCCLAYYSFKDRK
jgi:hypothetical protein